MNGRRRVEGDEEGRRPSGWAEAPTLLVTVVGRRRLRSSACTMGKWRWPSVPASGDCGAVAARRGEEAEAVRSLDDVVVLSTLSLRLTSCSTGAKEKWASVLPAASRAVVVKWEK